MKTISQETQQLIKEYQEYYQSSQKKEQKKEEVSTIHVDEVVSRVAIFYEKIRGIVDWKEEHLLRRTAIIRILKRRLLLYKNGEDIAKMLVLELIRGGHFPNDKIPETKIKEVQKIIDKYIFILTNSPQNKEKLKYQLYDWILGLSACEIEEALSPPRKEKALIRYMEKMMSERIKIKGEILAKIEISENKKNIQILIAVQRALFKLDSPIISYSLLKRRFPEWSEASSPLLKEIAENIYSIWKDTEKELSYPLADKFYQICERYNTPYLIIGDIISENPMKVEEKITHREVLENLIKEAYKKRVVTLKKRLGRAAVFATSSIFITKVAMALAIEIPLDKYLTGEFSYFVLSMNILIPPLLMCLLILTIRLPGKENLQRVIQEVMKIVYETKKKDIYQIKVFKKRSIVLRTAIGIFYFFSFCLTFGIIIRVLKWLNFGIFSQIIFIVFLSLITFAGVKIRERSKELTVEEPKETLLRTTIDFFVLPVIRLGKWLSKEWEKHNVLATLFNSFIEMPFQLFIEFLEQWRYFLKEMKEEIH